MGVVLGQGEPPFKEFKIFGLYEFFHGVLPLVRSLADDFQAAACEPENRV
jgi:hypothetical protein